MAFYGELWFWALIVGLILFFVGVIFYDYDRTRNTNETPSFVWILLVLGIVFLIIGLLTYILLEPSPFEKCCGSWRTSNNKIYGATPYYPQSIPE